MSTEWEATIETPLVEPLKKGNRQTRGPPGRSDRKELRRFRPNKWFFEVENASCKLCRETREMGAEKRRRELLKSSEKNGIGTGTNHLTRGAEKKRPRPEKKGRNR